MIDNILNQVGNLSIPGFFVAIQFFRLGKSYPKGLEVFIFEKLERINQGINGRRFVYTEEEWRLILTFYPTDRVVDEKYAMKNHIW